MLQLLAMKKAKKKIVLLTETHQRQTSAKNEEATSGW